MDKYTGYSIGNLSSKDENQNLHMGPNSQGSNPVRHNLRACPQTMINLWDLKIHCFNKVQP